MRSIAVLFMIGLLAGCITPYKEMSGRYIKPVSSEDRSPFGGNLTFGRLERCDGPQKTVWWYSASDFKNCVLLTKAEQDEWVYGVTRGSGPEIVGAAIVGGSVGAGAAVSGSNAAANVATTSVQRVTVGKHRR